MQHEAIPMTRRDAFRLISSWLILYATGVTFGCSTPDAPPSPATLEQVVRGRLTAVQMAIKQDGELAGEVIRVSVQGGTVVLDGNVQTLDEKQRAEKAAAGVRGVVKVDNRLTVRSSSP